MENQQNHPAPPLYLQRVKELRQANHSERQIANLLTAEAVPPPPRRTKWNQGAVRLALQQLEESEAAPPRSPSRPRPPKQPAPSPLASSAPASAPAKVAVHIHGPWIKQDGVLWEFLLHRVWDDLEKDRSHTLPLKDALPGLRPPSGPRDRAALCAALDRLARSCVVIDGESGPLRVNLTCALIAAATSENVVNYQFPEPLLRLVKLPQQYVQLQELLAAKK